MSKNKTYTHSSSHKPDTTPILKYPKEQYLKYFESWIEEALKALDVANSAYNLKAYPLAVYNLQQSVEKITKVFGLSSKILKSEADATRNINHQILKIFHEGAKPLLIQKRSQNDIRSSLSSLPFRVYLERYTRLYSHITSYDISEEDVQEHCRLLCHDLIETFNKGYNKLYEISQSYTKIDNINRLLDGMNVPIVIIELLPNIVEEAETPLAKETGVIDASTCLGKELRRLNVSQKKLSEAAKTSQIQGRNIVNSDRFVPLFKMFLLNISIIDLIKYLGIFLNYVEADSRYPSINPQYSPSEKYNESHILIMKYETFQMAASYLIYAVLQLLLLQYPELSSE